MQGTLKERYRLYREHKFLRSTLSNLENRIAVIDFTDASQVLELQTKLEEILSVMESHAKHENEVIHPLLKAKGSKVVHRIETNHNNYFNIFEKLNTSIRNILQTTNESELVQKGYEFYIAYRQFLVMDLEHINEEELVVMPELQKYYSDEELKRYIDFPVYAQMSSNDMVDMMLTLFPYMNADDKKHFLSDIQESQPEKFVKAWQGIAPSIDNAERIELAKKLKLPEASMSELVN